MIITITGIRPDFIRMSEIFKKLDSNFNHILIHTGQHYNKLLSDCFFQDLNIREPDYILDTGKHTNNHYEQLSYLSNNIVKLLKSNNLNPDIILFLGDSNSVCCALPLKKEGYKIGHIEAGMRSNDMRMLEEINRKVCDVCSDIHFVYHQDYKENLKKENIQKNVYIVGNTIVEICNQIKFSESKKNNLILIDIHRPENFKYKNRILNLFNYIILLYNYYKLPIKILNFPRALNYIENNLNINIKNYFKNIDFEVIDLLPYKKYLNTVFHSKFIISDSGTGQEEPALLKTPVIVPRDYTERPQSMSNNCSIMLNINQFDKNNILNEIIIFIKNYKPNIKWLGEGNTSNLVIQYLKEFLF